MNLKFWDSRARLISAIARLTDDEAREVVKKARPGWTLSAIGKRANKLDRLSKLYPTMEEVKGNGE